MGRADGGRLVSVAFVGFGLRPVGSIGQRLRRRDGSRQNLWFIGPSVHKILGELGAVRPRINVSDRKRSKEPL